MLGKLLRSNAVAVTLGTLALGSVIASSATAQTPAPAAPAAPAAATKTETFGNWGLRCPQPKVCQIQTARSTADKKFVWALVYSKSPTGQKLVGVVPLGFRLQSGPAFAIDGAAAGTGVYAQCMTSGCRVEIPVSDAVVRSLQSGKQSTLTVEAPNGNKVPLSFEMQGFSDAKAALDKRVQ